MPVRQMKLRFDAKPTTRVIPSQLVPAQPQEKGDGGNQKGSGAGGPAPVLDGGIAAGEAAASRPAQLTRFGSA